MGYLQFPDFMTGILPRPLIGLVERGLGLFLPSYLSGARHTGKALSSVGPKRFRAALRYVGHRIESGPGIERAAHCYNDARGLRTFLQEYGPDALGGLLLYGGDETLWISEGILAVPWWKII